MTGPDDALPPEWEAMQQRYDDERVPDQAGFVLCVDDWTLASYRALCRIPANITDEAVIAQAREAGCTVKRVRVAAGLPAWLRTDD